MSETEPVVHIGDQMPRIGSVSHRGVYEIVVSWATGPRERNADIVDLAPVILTHKFFRPLRDNSEMLKTVHVINDGAAIAWGDDDAIDMAATTIERLAEEAMDSADFRAWLERHKFTYDAAAAQLGISRRLVAYYASKRGVPRYIALACRYLDSELVPAVTDLAERATTTASSASALAAVEAFRKLIQETSPMRGVMTEITAGTSGKGSGISEMVEVLREEHSILGTIIKEVIERQKVISSSSVLGDIRGPVREPGPRRGRENY